MMKLSCRISSLILLLGCISSKALDYGDQERNLDSSDDVVDHQRSLGGAIWDIISFEDFEDGWDKFAPSPGDTINDTAIIIDSRKDPDVADNVYMGHGALCLNYEGWAYQTDYADVTHYSKLRVTFNAKGSTGGLKLHVEYNNTQDKEWKLLNWVGVKDFVLSELPPSVKPTRIVLGGEFAYSQVSFDFKENGYDMKDLSIRFRRTDTKKSGKNESFYIDNVKVEGKRVDY